MRRHAPFRLGSVVLASRASHPVRVNEGGRRAASTAATLAAPVQKVLLDLASLRLGAGVLINPGPILLVHVVGVEETVLRVTGDAAVPRALRPATFGDVAFDFGHNFRHGLCRCSRHVENVLSKGTSSWLTATGLARGHQATGTPVSPIR